MGGCREPASRWRSCASSLSAAARVLLIVVVLAPAVGASCSLQEYGLLEQLDGTLPDADADSARDGDLDLRSDGDADSDVDADSDGDADSEGDADSVVDTDSDGDLEADADGDLDTSGCPPGQVRCDEACVSIDSDPAHCGACSHVCPSGPNSAATCIDSICGLVCGSGWEDCDGVAETGCEAYLPADTANCGACGVTCSTIPNATAQCSEGACHTTCEPGFVELAGRCLALGGAFLYSECGGGFCANANPYTGGCTCPAGFLATDPAIRIINDCSAGGFSYVWASLWFCRAPERSEAGDWAGVYQRYGGVCMNGNPYTGGCSCPPTAYAIELIAEASGFEQTLIGVCVNGAAPTTSFAGAYESTDAGGCLVAHPLTGGCACPLGTSPAGLRTIAPYHWPGGDYGNWGASIALCIN